MGYRLNVSDPEKHLKFYGTKLYGYTDKRKLESYKYLESIGKVDDLTTFSGGIDNKMVLTPEQFREFIRLYKTDFSNYAGFEMSEIHEYNAIEEMLATENDKIVSWL